MQMVSSSSPTTGKPLDARLLDRPSGFDGEARRWPSWRLKFEAWLTMVDVEFGQWVKEARLATSPVPWSSMSSRARVLGAFLYAALVTLLVGSLLEVVAAVSDSNGWEAYRRVCSEVDPRAASQKLQVLEDLLEPQLGEAGNFYAKWLSWERRVKEAPPGVMAAFTDDIMIAIVRRRVPFELQSYLRVHALEYEGQYVRLHETVENYFRSQGITVLGAPGASDQRTGLQTAMGRRQNSKVNIFDQISTLMLDNVTIMIGGPSLHLVSGCAGRLVPTWIFVGEKCLGMA
jgi:hypothetical protein